jgi:hypothetical protein
MSLTVSIELLKETKAKALEPLRKSISQYDKDDMPIDLAMADDAALEEVASIATRIGDKKTAKAIESILNSRRGAFGLPIPNFKAFQGVLQEYLKSMLIDGWIYVTDRDGKTYPELVTSIDFDAPGRHQRGMPSVRVHTAYMGRNTERGMISYSLQKNSHRFEAAETARKRIYDILETKGIFAETAELKKEYVESMERHRKLTLNGFSKQFRVSGKPIHFETNDWQRRGEMVKNRKVIHDLDDEQVRITKLHEESSLLNTVEGTDGIGLIPQHPVVKVFDLKSHEFFWIHADLMEPYVYDKSLSSKLILPATHRDLLDVLTDDLDVFKEDFIEGKSAGNVILAKGIPGVGKTLTAEVYSELIERPLYSIHSGNLGTTAESIEKNLQHIFNLAKRWNCVILLDEADVFVMTRERDLEQNAIVAEFLRVLEYYDGLLFMTTNRESDIDDAILDRCIAIISYGAPDRELSAQVWAVMAAQFKTKFSKELIEQLLDLFPDLVPRNMKMLTSLVLRFARKHKTEPTIESFRQCAMFRNVKMATTPKAQA